jgi:glutaconyl-CoA/methylmalonyl-CoA decarboxylase subunit gamma
MKQFSFTINGNQYDVEIKSVDENKAEVEVNGFTYSVETDKVLQSVSKTPKLVVPQAVPSTDITPTEHKTSSPAPASPKGSGVSIKSPLPGIILDVFVNVGDTIKIGDKLCCLEAMKMENNINSDKAGTVTKIHIAKGSTVMEGDPMIEIG